MSSNIKDEEYIEDIVIVSSKITDMVIPYLRGYKSSILAVYLAPYKIGENKHVEISIVAKPEKELPILSASRRYKNIKMYLAVYTNQNYQINKDSIGKEIKDLKTGYVVYDNNKRYERKQKQLQQNEEVIPFYNSTDLPNELIDEVKVRLLSI